MNILQMSAKITTLSEKFIADVTAVRLLHRVLSEVVPQVATLAEYCVASFELTEENKFRTFSSTIRDRDCLVPCCWNSIKHLGARATKILSRFSHLH